MNSWILAKLHLRRMLLGRKGILLLIVPILIISGIVGLFGKASDVQVRIAVWNEDGGWLGERVIQSVRTVGLYELEVQDEAGASLEELKEGVYDGRWGALVHIPPSFSETMLAGGETQVGLYRKNEQQWSVALGFTLTETADRLAGSIALAAASTSDAKAREAIVQQLLDLQETGGLQIESQSLVHRNSNSFVLVIGLALMFIMILVNQSIHGIIEDRSNRTIARIYSAPVRAWEIALGNFLGCFLIGACQVLLILTITRYVIGFDLGIPFGTLAVVMLCFLLAAVGVMSAAAALVKNAAQLGNIINLIVIPTSMLGGCFWPVSMMPDFMQKLANFTPQRWAIIALEQASSGESLSSLGLPLGVLLLFAAVLLSFGSYVLRPAER
ncbi:ABC transporter permease [Cohnella boryungensis]|uniref:ABC transporter permease n=1 Tax=Cohnella boryungensis TaxID=768479 RepID=A0ABV8SE65_9BACL